jgi:uncharacterized protein (DUF4415 family)
MNKNSILKTSNDEYPEITQADFDRAIIRKGLNPVEKKQRITIMLDRGVVGYFKSKAGKRGYQTLINEALKRVVNSKTQESNRLENTLRKVIREELDSTKYAH